MTCIGMSGTTDASSIERLGLNAKKRLREKVLQKKALKLMHRGSIGQQPRKVHNREVRMDILENNKSEPRRKLLN